jgi:hypothetical protein
VRYDSLSKDAALKPPRPHKGAAQSNGTNSR